MLKSYALVSVSPKGQCARRLDSQLDPAHPSEGVDLMNNPNASPSLNRLADVSPFQEHEVGSSKSPGNRE